MPADAQEPLASEARGALRTAAPRPRTPVEPGPVLERGRRLQARRRVLRTALGLLLLLPVGGALLARLGSPAVDLAAGGAPVPALLPPLEGPPHLLADGRPPADVPAAVESRFGEPVVAARRAAALPASARERCATPPLALPAGDAPVLGARLQRLADGAAAPLVHAGPAAITSLAVGVAEAPPGYPDRYGVSCIARPGPTGHRSDGAHVEHLFHGWTGYAPPAPGSAQPWLWTTALAVPGGARWAVQEEHGWWLAYEVSGSSWLLAQTARPSEGADAPPRFPGVRVVFLDRDGRTVAEERLRTAVPPDAPYMRDQATAATLHLGSEADVRAALAEGGPLPACAPERTVCVWVVDAGGELLALSAASPLPAEVPPFGFVGWCPAEGTFAESQLGSRFALDGTWLAGPAPGGLHRYAVAVQDGEVRVELARFSAGAARSPQGADVPSRCSRLEEPGFDLP